MVLHVNIYGHMQLDTLIMTVPHYIGIHVLHHQDHPLLLLLHSTITVNLEQMPTVESHTTCLNLYGMEVIVLLIVAVISTYDSVSMFIHARKAINSYLY